MRRTALVFLVMILARTTDVTMAQSASAQAVRLGGLALTPIGAERAGNAEGTIPPWRGGITQLPPDYNVGDHHPDPYPDDARQFTITVDNLDDYTDRLSDGQKALLRAYPDTWRMHIYPTRRSASYPDWVYDAVKANATTAALIPKGKGGVLHATIGAPFPIPQSGIEVVWNHLLRWRGVYISGSNGLAAVTTRGRYRVTITKVEFAIAYASRRLTPLKRRYPNLLFAFKRKTVVPGRLAGEGSLVLEYINQSQNPRQAWLYNPNLRRVIRAPYLAYDYPSQDVDGLFLIDEFDMYNGSPDRFEWTLLGKKDLYIPYNAYRLHSGEVTYRDLLKRGHINPELARYELHRVWVVQGVRRKGAKHVYSRRLFYLDEDTWQIAVADSYDKQGRLWRIGEAHALNYYEVPAPWHTLLVSHDLKVRRYAVTGLDNQRNMLQFFEQGNPRLFSPNALSYYAR